MSLPPSEIPQGAIRFNTDSQRLEFYAQGEWWVMSTDTPNLGRSVDSTPGARGVWAGGQEAPVIHGDIEYVNITSTGNSVDFGTNITTRRRASAFASSTRMVVNGGSTPSPSSVQEFLTFSSTGTVTAWGDTLNNSGSCDNAGFGNQTRGITKAGYSSPGITGVMDYVTIASAGNTQDFGDMTNNGDAPAAAANSTRGLFGGGFSGPTSGYNAITFVTIHTLGDSVDFGDLIQARHSAACAASPTRIVWFSGNNNIPTMYNIIDYVTIASTGNATDFGDPDQASSTGSGVSNCIRGVFAGGYSPSQVSNIQYINFSTEGDAVDFGDLSIRPGGKGAAASNGHGGL